MPPTPSMTSANPSKSKTAKLFTLIPVKSSTVRESIVGALTFAALMEGRN